MNSIENFYFSSTPFIKEFNSFVTKHALKGVSLPDHICYRCSTSKSFEKIRTIFENEGEYIFQSIISKRRIAIIKFKKAIATDLGPIWYLELSDQKPDGSQKEGFDHLEIYGTKISYEKLVQKLESEGESVIKVERPHHTTHDIKLSSGFEVKLTKEPLIEKIKREEMI